MPQDLHDLVVQTRAAADRGDIPAIAALYHPNACLPTIAGRFAIGRDAIAEHFAAVLPGVPADIHHEPTQVHIHHVTPQIALVDSIGETCRATASGEREVLSVEAFTMVAVREGNEWLWAGVRGVLLPKEPSS